MKFFQYVKNPGEMFSSLFAMPNSGAGDGRYHLSLACGWLLRAQSVNSDGGYSHSYSLSSGWAPSYPETTGYIIPTMLGLGGYLNDWRCEESALKAGEWLSGIQQADGSFLDLSGQRQVFDTGQIIEGLIALYKRTKNRKYINSAQRAGDFLVEIQDGDGKWTRFSYNKTPHTYYSRVSANLLKLYEITGDAKFKASSERNLQWVMAAQRENGYFDFMSFVPGEPPYLHTIVYVLEGLLESYTVLGDKELLDCVKKTVDGLLGINEERDVILYSQYDENWNYPKKEKCTVGLAQWAGLLLDMYAIIKNKDYLTQALKTIFYLKSKQIQKGSENIRGAIPGSIPVWGRYFPFTFNNWTVKFYADALLKAVFKG